MAKAFVADSTPVQKLEVTINGLLTLAGRQGFTEVLNVQYFPTEYGKQIPTVPGGSGGSAYAKFYDIILMMDLHPSLKKPKTETGLPTPPKEDSKPSESATIKEQTEGLPEEPKKGK